MENNYEFCFISNNDVLVGAGSIQSMVKVLQSFDLVVPYTKRGAGATRVFVCIVTHPICTYTF
jgi:hypothetical protein